MADLRGGSLVGGFPVIGKNASDNNIGKIKGNLMVNSLLSDDGIKVTSTGDIYVRVAGVDKKVFHEGNLVASGSSTSDFSAKDIFVSGLVQMGGITVIDAARNLTNIGTISSSTITSTSSVQGASFKLGTTTIVDASRNLLSIGTISSGAITSTGLVQGTSFNVGATNIIDASRNLVNIGTIGSGAITSTSFVRGTYFSLAGVTVIDTSRNLTNIGALTMDGSLRINSGSFELGSNSIAQTAYVDFNSSATASDYDARISTTGGTATAGQGTLTLTAVKVVSSSDIYVGASKVFHEGNLVASGSATQDFTAKTLTATNVKTSTTLVIPVGIDKYAIV